MPELAADLDAVADGIETHDVRAIELARRVADRSLRALCAETGIAATESVGNLIDLLLEKHVMPHTIAAHLRLLYDPESTLVGDAGRALVAFLEWRVGSRSRMSAMPARPSRVPQLLIGAIAVVGLAIAVVVIVRRDDDPHPPPPPIAAGPMARIAGATFEMGSTDLELSAAIAYCREVDHRGGACTEDSVLASDLQQEQLRRVTISAFEIDRREVTVAEFVTWLAVHPQHHRAYPNIRVDRESGSCVAAAGREQFPIAGVTWDEARRYCEDVGKRLPTEAEWELAARGPGRRLFPWGDQPPTCAGMIFGRDLQRPCALGTTGDAGPVGSAPGDVTPDGVYDLGGNVSEWTADGGGDRPRCSAACVDPRVPEGVTRVVRGGNWSGPGGELRAARRFTLPPDIARTNLGFRCAR